MACCNIMYFAQLSCWLQYFNFLIRFERFSGGQAGRQAGDYGSKQGLGIGVSGGKFGDHYCPTHSWTIRGSACVERGIPYCISIL